MNKSIKPLPIFKKTVLLSLYCLLAPFFCIAQETSSIDNLFESNNKIYVVVLVLSTIFVGIILTLVYLELRIKKLEKNQRSKNVNNNN